MVSINDTARILNINNIEMINGSGHNLMLGTYNNLAAEKIFNFLGTAVGFLVLYYLIRKGSYSILEKQYTLITISDVILLIIALLGISGYLPWVAYKIADRVAEILGRKTKEKDILERIKSIQDKLGKCDVKPQN